MVMIIINAEKKKIINKRKLHHPSFCGPCFLMQNSRHGRCLKFSRLFSASRKSPNARYRYKESTHPMPVPEFYIKILIGGNTGLRQICLNIIAGTDQTTKMADIITGRL